MPATAVKPNLPRKRNRKRKRRAASSDSSSSSSDSSSDEETVPKTVVPVSKKLPIQELSSSESESSSSSESEDERVPQVAAVPEQTSGLTSKFVPRRNSPSPPPPSAVIPSFIPPPGAAGQDPDHQEQILKDRFRKFWMAAVVDGFKDDLEEIRKEPALETSRLNLLIDSLASGADVFTSTNANGINEMDVVLQ